MKVYVTYVIDIGDEAGDQSLAVLHAAEAIMEKHPGVKSVECLDTRTED